MQTTLFIFHIKKICAVLLLISFFLPLSRGCSQIDLSFQKESVKQKEKKPLFSVEEYEGKKKYAYDIIRSPDTHTVAAGVVLFCYLWPIPILLCHHFIKRRIMKLLITCAELIFCMGTVHFVIMLVAFDKLLIGSYLAISSNPVKP